MDKSTTSWAICPVCGFGGEAGHVALHFASAHSSLPPTAVPPTAVAPTAVPPTAVPPTAVPPLPIHLPYPHTLAAQIPPPYHPTNPPPRPRTPPPYPIHLLPQHSYPSRQFSDQSAGRWNDESYSKTSSNASHASFDPRQLQTITPHTVSEHQQRQASWNLFDMSNRFPGMAGELHDRSPGNQRTIPQVGFTDTVLFDSWSLDHF